MSIQIGAEHLRVEAEDLRARLESGRPLTVLDARGDKAWEESDGKIPGAARVDPENVQIDPSWPRDRFTVVYSADLHDATSAAVALQLSDANFRDVHVLHGGIEAWQKIHGPMERK